MEPLALIIDGWEPERWMQRIKEFRPDANVRAWPDLGPNPESFTYAMAWKPSAEAINALPNLKVMFSLGAGVDHIFRSGADIKVPVVRVIDDDLTNRMSEYIVLHTLLHHRRQRMFDKFQQDRIWKEVPQPVACEVRVGILGFGVLGQDAAVKLKMLGYDVAGWSKSQKEVEGIKSYYGDDQLDAFLGRTDILVVLLPHTSETHGILNYGLFKKLAQDGVLGGPYLINAGRGKLQVEEDIVWALQDGTLLAATLDVFETEPLPQTSVLWDQPNLIITPHNAADSEPTSITRMILKQIDAYERGEPLPNIVDPTKGY